MNFSQLIIPLLGSTWGQQAPSLADDMSTCINRTRIAVIGAGIAGASVVYGLSNTTAALTHITLFEREAAVGGRIHSVMHDARFGGPFEDGSAWLSTDDTCLMEIVGDLGLRHGERSSGSRRGMDDWGRGRTSPISQVTCDVSASYWRRLTEIFWNCSHHSRKIRILAKLAGAGWQYFLQPEDTGGDLKAAMARAGFTGDLLGLADSLLVNPTGNFTIEQHRLQACTMGRLYQSHDEVSSLSALLAARKSTLTAVTDGNTAMVQRTLNRSQADQRLNSTVISIGPGRQRRYRVTHVSGPEQQKQHSEFDLVVLAAPLLPSGIRLDIPSLDASQAPRIAYKERHVTHLMTPWSLSSNGTRGLNFLVLPDYRLTSSATQDNLIAIEARIVGWLAECAPEDALDCDHFEEQTLYRIVSRHRLTDADLINLVEQNPRSNMTHAELTDLVERNFRARLQPSDPNYLTRDELTDLMEWLHPEEVEGSDRSLQRYGITWTRSHAWPNALPGPYDSDLTVPQSTEIAPGLFYTSGLDHIITSMEMSCRTGRHVAGRINQRLSLQDLCQSKAQLDFPEK